MPCPHICVERKWFLRVVGFIEQNLWSVHGEKQQSVMIKGREWKSDCLASDPGSAIHNQQGLGQIIELSGPRFPYL